VSDSRDRLFRRVLLNAATKPLNVLMLAGMAAVAILTTPWVLAAAIPVYGLMIAATIRDPKETDRLARRAEQHLPGGKRSLEGITGGLRGQVIAVLNEERGIVAELAKAPVRPEGIQEAVEKLCDELIVNARRASDVDLYLRSVDVADLQRRLAEFARLGRESPRSADAASAIQEQLQVVEALARKRAALDEEIANLQASLGTIRARLVQARAEASVPTVGAADVTELRDRMRALADGLAEAYGHNSESPTTMKGT
jgi:chromosome segregation ATPase